MMLSMLCLHWLVHCCVPLCASSMQGPHPHARPPNVPHTICTMCMHNAYAHTRTHYLASFGINRRPSPVRSVFSCANICVAFHLMGGSGTLKWGGGRKKWIVQFNCSRKLCVGYDKTYDLLGDILFARIIGDWWSNGVCAIIWPVNGFIPMRSASPPSGQMSEHS